MTPDPEPWKASVTLVFKYGLPGGEAGDHNYGQDLNRQRPFYPWTESTSPSKLFAVVTNKKALKDVLARAQVAILNPGEDPTRFQRGPIPNKNQVDFSPNYISIQIHGPNLPNLSFYDLPGIINQTEDENKDYLIKIVRNLALEYIRDESSLVLLACSMENDIHISSAAALVQKADANHRCIGVLTKPDRLPPGEPVAIWRDILLNRKFTRGHGYFVTKQPAALTHGEARQREEAFFQTDEPWARQLAEFKCRFGTRNIQQALSRKLATQILRRHVETFSIDAVTRLTLFAAYPKSTRSLITGLQTFKKSCKATPSHRLSTLSILS